MICGDSSLIDVTNHSRQHAAAFLTGTSPNFPSYLWASSPLPGMEKSPAGDSLHWFGVCALVVRVMVSLGTKRPTRSFRITYKQRRREDIHVGTVMQETGGGPLFEFQYIFLEGTQSLFFWPPPSRSLASTQAPPLASFWILSSFPYLAAQWRACARAACRQDEPLREVDLKDVRAPKVACARAGRGPTHRHSRHSL